MTIDGLPLTLGDQGVEVRDLQARLRAVSAPELTPSGSFDAATQRAVEHFQLQRGLTVDGRVEATTWRVLVEASYRLGDRLLYLRTPMLRGDDVEDLQRRVGALGFDAGRVDGIFGPDTETAVRDFQRNAGLTSDGIFGPDTLAALTRLGASRTEGDSGAQVRELERLRQSPRQLGELRIVVGETGGAGALVAATARLLRDAGATVLVSNDPDWSTTARRANTFDAEVFVGLALEPHPGCGVGYFATTGFRSVGGAHLASRIAERIGGVLGLETATEGRRVAILRETKMPAVLSQIGPADIVVTHLPEIAAAIRDALADWASRPVDT